MTVFEFLNNESEDLVFSYIGAYDAPDLMKRVNIYNSYGTKMKFNSISSFVHFITKVEMLDWNEDQGNWTMAIYI